jgi:hypothetical protein
MSAHDNSSLTAATDQRIKAVIAAHIERQALALRVVQHKNTFKAACLAHFLHVVSKNLLNLHDQMHKEASNIARQGFHTGSSSWLQLAWSLG